MGAYTCEFGFVHKVCRCPTPHTIKCDKPTEHDVGLGVDEKKEVIMETCYACKQTVVWSSYWTAWVAGTDVTGNDLECPNDLFGHAPQ